MRGLWRETKELNILRNATIFFKTFTFKKMSVTINAAFCNEFLKQQTPVSIERKLIKIKHVLTYGSMSNLFENLLMAIELPKTGWCI